MDSQSTDRVWSILQKHSVGMLTTAFSGGLRARPLDARPDREQGAILFLTDVRGLKDDEVAAHPDVCFAIAAASENIYLSITGRAAILEDAQTAARIWKSTDDVWWPRRENDPNVRVLRIDPATAELWDGPRSSLMASWEFAKARLTGRKPELGEKRKTTIDMAS